jgi:hypothetical protein
MSTLVCKKGGIRRIYLENFWRMCYRIGGEMEELAFIIKNQFYKISSAWIRALDGMGQYHSILWNDF